MPTQPPKLVSPNMPRTLDSQLANLTPPTSATGLHDFEGLENEPLAAPRHPLSGGSTNSEFGELLPPARKAQDPFSPIMWGALCLELLQQPEQMARTCARFNTNVPEVEHLLTTNSAFKDTLREAKVKIRTMGPSAGFVLRSQAMVESYLPAMDAIVKNTNESSAIRVRLFESLTRYARLDPAQEKRDPAQSANQIGVAVTLNFDRKLQHLIGGAEVVDITPTDRD